MKPCPCHSGKPYEECCKPYHESRPAENALALMRSRYSAYALLLSDYIIQTTHPNNRAFSSNTHWWRQEIQKHYGSTDFYGLKILAFIDGENEAYVTFTAQLRQKNRDISFTEKSRFLKVNDRWLYESGEIFPQNA